MTKNDTVKSLIEKIYPLPNVGLRPRSPNIELVLAEVSDKRLRRVLDPATSIKQLENISKSKELYAFEVFTKDYSKPIEGSDADDNLTKNSTMYVVDNKYTAYNNASSCNPAVREYKRAKPEHVERGSNYFIHAFNRIITHDDGFTWKRYDPVLRGNPILISLNTKMTHLDLYEQAWNAVVRYLKPGSKYTDNKNCWWNNYKRLSVRREIKQPFIIRLVKNTGIACSKCSWREQCLGCSIIPDQKQLTLDPTEYISLDWYLDTFEDDYWEIKEIEEREYFIKTKEFMQRPLKLKEIFKKFTTPEDMASAKCEVCKEMTKHKKTLSFSRFPVILILHLKRYNEK